MAHLVAKDYEWLEANDAGDRLTATDVRRVIQEYGRELVAPPDGAWLDLEPVPLPSAPRPTWALAIPLWTREEGRSDLTLELTLWRTADGSFGYELDDVHVL